MSRVHAYLRLVDDPSSVLPPAAPHELGDDEALLSLLVHLAFADGIVQGDEFALLERVRPDLSMADLMAWTMEASQSAMDWDALLAALPDAEARWAGLRFAARMTCLDGNLAADELDGLRQVAKHLQLDEQAVRRAVDEVVARVEAASPDAVADALRNMLWDELIPDRDPPTSDMGSVLPDGASVVCRLLVHGEGDDDEEVGVVLQEGLALRFDDGPAFVPWGSIHRYTRVPVPGAAFHLHTETGHLAVSDPRLRDLGILLDVVYGRRPVERTA
jgi:DnaJ-domain-containing protein 1